MQRSFSAAWTGGLLIAVGVALAAADGGKSTRSTGGATPFRVRDPAREDTLEASKVQWLADPKRGWLRVSESDQWISEQRSGAAARQGARKDKGKEQKGRGNGIP